MSRVLTEVETMMNALQIDADRRSRKGRSLSKRRPSITNHEDHGNVTIGALLEQPSALSGQLDLYVPPTRRGEEGLLVERFFILANRTLYMFVTRSTFSQPLASLDLTPNSYIVADIKGATELAMELVGEIGLGQFKSWILCARNMATKSLWVDMINHSITASVNEVAKFSSARSVPRINTYAMSRTQSYGGSDSYVTSPVYADKRGETNTRLSQRQIQEAQALDLFQQGLEVQYNSHRRESESSLNQVATPTSDHSRSVEDNIFFEASRKMNSQYSTSSTESAEPKKTVKRRVKTAIMGIL
ncbi:hypothetical protein HDU99_001263 [Rhizoclosmatium hyalinum]|nr:hypothetical protein HDU99_001263 [Rhizoclosmatium hyalinum]